MSPKVAEEHKEARRKQILEAAARVFIRLGYQAATMKDVVEESGLSRGGVYLYYGSTEQMMLDLIEEGDREVDEMPKMLQDGVPVWDVIEGLIRGMTADMDQASQGLAPVYYELFITGWRKRAYESLMARRYSRSLEAFVGLLEEGARRKEFHPPVPVAHIAKMVFSFHDGLQIHAIQFGADLVDVPGQTEAMLLGLKHLLGLGVTSKEEFA